MTATAYASQSFVKVAPYLYRTEAGMYYGKIKREGKIHKQSLKTEDLQTAKRKLKDFIGEIESKTVESPDITFDEAIKLWLESLYDLKPNSKARRVTSLNAITPAFKGRKLRTITKQELVEWAAGRAKEVTARTFNIDRETLRLLFRYAKDTLHVVSDNHAQGLAKRKSKKTHVVPPTKEQFAALVAYIDVSKRKHKDDLSRNAAMFVRFLAYTGMRLEEARCVRWKHVDFKKGTLLVTGGEGGTKNHSERTIPLFPPVRDLFAKFPEDQRKASELVFNLTTAREVLISASEAIGLKEGEHFTHHSMRHFFCSNAIEEGIDFARIAEWLGHSDGGKLAAGTYGHLRKSHGDEQAKKMTFSA
jgi:integrase